MKVKAIPYKDWEDGVKAAVRSDLRHLTMRHPEFQRDDEKADYIIEQLWDTMVARLPS